MALKFPSGKVRCTSCNKVRTMEELVARRANSLGRDGPNGVMVYQTLFFCPCGDKPAKVCDTDGCGRLVLQHGANVVLVDEGEETRSDEPAESVASGAMDNPTTSGTVVVDE